MIIFLGWRYTVAVFRYQGIILEGGSETPTYFRNYSFIVVSLHWLVQCGVHQPYAADTNPIKPR